MKRKTKLSLLLGGTSLLVPLAILSGIAPGCATLGARARGARLERVERSPEWTGRQFENPQPLINDIWRSVVTLFEADENVTPRAQPPYVPVEAGRFATPPPSGLRVTWFGHSSLLLEIDGHRFLMDPMWSERVGPVGWAGPKRWYPPPIALADLPAVDAVIISHDHYDHLDYGTVKALTATGVRFIVPLGVGAHLARWGVAEDKITELDWWQGLSLGDLRVTATPARHASGRTLIFDNDATLWAGYALVGPMHRVYFSGDTGLFPGLKEIGARLGPFDLTMIEVGQYDAAWPDWHSGPEQAVRAHQMVGGRVMLPIHWGLFALASHGWTEPIERTLVAAQKSGVVVMTPKPGESVDPTAPPAVNRWWPSLPWKTAEQAPIVADQMN
jgi:L-ascorbate metabolism protein UlaG (beta-lactamase superfamily)